MPAIVDLSGIRFGRLIAVRLAARAGKHTFWNCSCDCGATSIARSNNLRRGHTKSCGCLDRELRAHWNEVRGAAAQEKRQAEAARALGRLKESNHD
jgi:hypothetical protein